MIFTALLKVFRSPLMYVTGSYGEPRLATACKGRLGGKETVPPTHSSAFNSSMTALATSLPHVHDCGSSPVPRMSALKPLGSIGNSSGIGGIYVFSLGRK